MNTAEFASTIKEYGYRIAVEVLTHAMHSGEFANLCDEAMARAEECADEEEIHAAVELSAREYVTLLIKRGDLK